MTSAFLMQPHYLPYCGFFSMLDAADVCVLLDTVEVDRKSWQMRNRIRARDGNVVWLTVPTHARQGQPLNEVEIASQGWQYKHWRTIHAAYQHTPGWPLLLADVCGVLLREWENLSDLTSALTASIAQGIFGIDTPIVRASDLGSTRAGKAERIIDICREVDADVLLDTPGAQAFLGDHDLDGIRIDWHRYEPAPYSQGDQPWHPYLSVIDTIAWHGTDALSIVRKGRTAAATTPGIG